MGMDEIKLTELLRQKSAEVPGHTPFCPEDQVITGYFEGTLAETEHAALKRHLLDCRFCMGRIGNLERVNNDGQDKAVPGSVLADAKRLAGSARQKRRLRRAPAWAVAAVLVMAVFLSFSHLRDDAPSSGAVTSVASSTENHSRQLRSVQRNPGKLNVLNPVPGANIKPGALIRWEEVPGNLHYDVFVLSSTGDVLWTERVKGTDWALHESLDLAAGSKYYLRVEAHSSDGISISSRHVDFRVMESR